MLDIYDMVKFLKGGEKMFAQILANIGGLFAEVTPIITSSDWDTVTTTVTTTAQAAILPALGVLTITVGVPIAKKVFKKVAN